MIHVFSHPIEPTALDEFHKARTPEGEEPANRLFDATTKRRKEVKYLADGRKEVDGALQEKKAPNELWATTITRGMAQEWRERAEGGRLHQARIYLREMVSSVGALLKRNSPSEGVTTALLVALNLCLLATLLRIMNVF